MDNGRSLRLIDVWQQASRFFMGYSEEAPEIVLAGMAPLTMQDCLFYLMTTAREVTTQFVMLNTNIQVVTPSPLMAARALSAGHIGGGLWLDLPLLPTLGIFVDGPHAMSISFVRGEWDAMSLGALFVLLRELYIIAPQLEVGLLGTDYAPDERADFADFVRTYCHEVA
ncbi:MAG: hypothetical protein H6670_06935 [Anaerolineaceae bacterium]|nr:hypothetical protein [Anaerolineaceae bacterium]